MRTGIDVRYALRKSRRGIGNYIFHLLKEFSHLRSQGVTFYLYGDRAADPEVTEYFQENSFVVRVLSSPKTGLVGAGGFAAGRAVGLVCVLGLSKQFRLALCYQPSSSGGKAF